MIGKEILNYVIIAKLGSGGMGSVYLAEHKFIKQQKVAIKVINSTFFNDFAKTKLKEEAERLASLDHPNIVKFLNYDIDAKGNVYLVMEYAEGATLDQYINSKTGLIVEEKILPLFEPILDAFDYAHKKKVVHRDIKPANIIITTDGVPKILDFGISTIVDDAQSAEETFIMGTPSYMSPEQVRGKGIDTRSDIYSLGVLLHQMLTGNAPYDTTTLSEQDINEKVISEPLPRMKAYYHYISDKMQSIVDKATDKDVNKRFQTCGEFKRAMRKALIKEPVSKPLKIVAVVAVLAILSGLGYWWDYNRVKVRYYKDYVEQWGIPQGIGELSSSEHAHMHRMYRFEYQKHKLRRVSHVNSFDHLIDDGESERNERPVDMRLFYAANGNISKAKVYDRSGKVMYVKAYNDKLNAVVFQYDDEYGTEKSLGTQTIGYVNALNDSGAKGRISRWLIEYDEDGYVISIRYAGFQNVLVADAHNIYGRRYVRDAKGRVAEEHYMAFDGSPKATTWGLGIKKFYYDEMDNWIKAEYLTVDGAPALDDADGVCIYTLDYDKYGNELHAYHRNSDGSMMSPKKHGIASVKHTYDDCGLLIETAYLDVDGQPCYERNNISKCVYSYDDNGYVNRMDCYDTDGKLCLITQGWASKVFVNDTHGDPIEQWCYGLNGELVADPDGLAGYRAKYDSIGNEIERIFYGIDEKPCNNPEGNAGLRIEYDDRNLISKITYLGEELTPEAGDDHVGVIRVEYDRRGNVTKRAFYDATDSHLVMSQGNIAGWKSTYDDNGHEIERAFFDDKENPCLCDDGNAKWTATYDEYGNRTGYRYYDLKGALTLVNGIAGYDYQYDERGNVLESVAVGTDEKLAVGYLIVRNKYDSSDNEIETAGYDKNYKPALNGNNIHKITYKYNSRNQRIEARYYGTTGNLTCYDDDKYAVLTSKYDEKGNIIESRYYDVNEKLVRCNAGWAYTTQEYDAMGRIVKQSYFDENEMPTDPSWAVPESFCEYDKWSNLTYIASGDGYGNLIYNPQTGCCITRYTRDRKGNLLEVSYYDENDLAMNNRKLGYHKLSTEYTEANKIKQQSYYDTNGKPATTKEGGYHKATYEYNELGKETLEAFWSISGKAAECSYGYHRCEQTYNESGVSISRKFYNKANQCFLTQTWNGSEWISEVDWKPQIRELNSNCPFDFGDDYGNLTMVSAKVTGNYSCSITFKVPLSKFELSSELSEAFQAVVAEMVSKIKEDLPATVYATGVLIDRVDREIYRVTK